MILKKTKVRIKNISEKDILELIKDFADKCENCACVDCNIIKNGINLSDDGCMARYIYENIIDIK